MPLIDGCLAEGPTPETATNAIIPEIAYFIQHDQELVQKLKHPPEILITEVAIKPE